MYLEKIRLKEPLVPGVSKLQRTAGFHEKTPQRPNGFG
jgi:hypothetical protein